MKSMNKRFLVLIAWGLIVCLPPLSARALADPLVVYTVNYPLQYFTGRIAAEHAEVVFPAPAGEDPAFWTPAPETVGQYQRADLIVLNGAGYAKWVSKASLPRLRLVDSAAAFGNRLIVVANTLIHSHGPSGEHSHAGTAFTTWLDLSQAAKQAEAIVTALARKRPAQAAEFRRRYAALEKELLSLDAEIESIVAADPQRPLLASHPVYQYFARRYGLKLNSVLWESDEVPTEVQWAELAETLESHPARWMIWESEPTAVTAERLASLGVHSLVFDPCATVPEHGDFMRVMRDNVSRLRAAFQ
jgi:zinc transport system substrate-binding protein